MRGYMRMELRRAFCSTKFIIAFSVAMGICIWHFVENVVPLGQYMGMNFKGEYPHSAFAKWIGGEWGSLQPTLYYLIVPILCAVPYGRSFYFDTKSGFIVQMITRGKKKAYIAAKFISSFFTGAVIAVVPLLFNFLLTNTVVPSIMPQSGIGHFPIGDENMMSELFYSHPFLYLFLYLMLDAVFFGMLNIISLWAVSFVSNGFWIVLMPFLFYTFIFCIARLVNQEQFAPVFFLRPCQPCSPDASNVLLEFLILFALNLFFFVWYQKREKINYE